MADYQLWLLNDDYSKSVYLDKWLRLQYRLGLNQMCGATLALAANDPKIADIALMQRLRVVREGEVVFNGLLQAERWTIAETAPQGDLYELDALDLACYLDWRTIPRDAGADYDVYNDHADDVAKAVVRAHLGTGAPAERQFSDLSVAADTHTLATCQRSYVGNTVLEELIALARIKQFYWRIVPSLTGGTFTTYYPLAGLDRTKGNGINDELVFAPDRHNVRSISYLKDLTAHYNAMYVAGPGEGKDQLVEIRTDSGYIASYKRRERWISATNYSTSAGLQNEGDREIEARKPHEELGVVPAVGALTPTNLGDKVTVFANRYGRAFERDMLVQALDIEVGADGVEQIMPELVTV